MIILDFPGPLPVTIPGGPTILADQLGWPPDRVDILGTDINPTFLRKAREGLYRPWSFRGTDVHRDSRYFQAEGPKFRLRSDRLGRVRFAGITALSLAYKQLAA